MKNVKDTSTKIECLKDSFYEEVQRIMWQEPLISNIGVQNKFEVFVLHLEVMMIYPRIKNQFKLALAKFKEDTGQETSGHLKWITGWIDNQPKNY